MSDSRSDQKIVKAPKQGRRLFFTEFLKHRRDIGSIVPSSRFLVNKMLKWVDFEQARLVVELGPGEGCITRQIVPRLHPEARLLVFEINERFCELLRQSISDERVEIVHASAENLKQELAQRGFAGADFIVSGIPFVAFPDALRQAIWQQITAMLKPPGRYVQYHFSPLLHKQYRQLFHEVKMEFTLLNIPPAYVFACRDARRSGTV